MNKPFVFKARIKVADLFHHSHHEEAFTTAMLNRESSEHFALKLLGICALSYERHASWSKSEEKLQPDVWLCDEQGEVSVALYIGVLELDYLTKLDKRYQKLVLLCVDAEAWYQERQVQLQCIDGLSVFSMPQNFITALCDMLQRSLHWDVIIDEGTISVTDDKHYIRAAVTKLQ
ncbi:MULTISPECIES: YaeQ family protein [unclassified Pseudoalteromonas]|uniref:YaeQ family protein n=1 Tax=unclassified Pseudoalteromonas TaxID=194690 RepID=UPI003014A907